MKIFKKFLFVCRKILFRGYRENQIINILLSELKDLDFKNKNETYKILDFGSGKQPDIIFKLIQRLNNESNKIYHADCYDFYSDYEIEKLNDYNNSLSFYSFSKNNNYKTYNVTLIIDVLHHIDLEDLNEVKSTIKKIKSHTEYIIIKDHFEYSLISNLLLRIMDFVGNYHNGVFIPKKYFTKKSYKNLIEELNLKEIKRITNINYHRSYWLFFSQKKFHFLSVLKVE